jgi:hypothetical protein
MFGKDKPQGRWWEDEKVLSLRNERERILRERLASLRKYDIGYSDFHEHIVTCFKEKNGWTITYAVEKIKFVSKGFSVAEMADCMDRALEAI